MSERRPVPSRTVRGWVVVSRTGLPIYPTSASTRREAIINYDHFIGPYDVHRRKGYARAVRATLTTDGAR